MQYLTILALPFLAAAAPTKTILEPRAGAPSSVTLPADCPVYSSYPQPNQTAFAPTSNYMDTALYTFTLSPGATSPDGTNDTLAVQDCLNTCYGYGNPGECVSVWSAHGSNVQEYGTSVYAEFVCKLFGTPINSTVLGPNIQGEEDQQAHALTIGCGPRSS